MDQEHAEQIAILLNSRNQLSENYDADAIMERLDDFLYEICDDKIIACIEVKKVQWYQWEISHLSVSLAFENQGIGRMMIQRAEQRATVGRAKVLQCTIRKGNESSEHTFHSSGFNQVSVFYNPITRNEVTVWQKIISQKH